MDVKALDQALLKIVTQRDELSKSGRELRCGVASLLCSGVGRLPFAAPSCSRHHDDPLPAGRLAAG